MNAATNAPASASASSAPASASASSASAASGTRPRLIHLTTADISLELLLGPQLSAFAQAGYEVIAMSAPGPFVPAVEARGIRHVALDNATRSMDLFADVRALRELVRQFRTLRPDIVHTHNPKTGVYGRIAAKIARVPVIINTVHGLYATPEDRLVRRVAVYGAERIAAICSDRELVQNVEDIATLRSLRIPERRIRLLGNGIDLDRFGPPTPEDRAAVRHELDIADGAVVVGAVGRLVEEKGYRELIAAWQRVRAEVPNAVLLIVGPHEPDKADALDAATIAQAEADGVRFLGMRDDVERLYRALDVYVLLSYREGFPRSAMEAAASGLPIIATDIRGCRQVVDDGVTGRLIPVRDADAAAQAIVDLCTDPPLRHTMSAAAIERAATHFDQRNVVSVTLAAYRELLPGRPAVTRADDTTRPA